MAHAKKRGSGKTLLAVGVLCIAAACAAILYAFSGKEEKPVATASVKPDKSNAVNAANANVGTVLVPDGQGTCHKYSYGNDSGKAVYEGTAPCDHTRPKEGRASLPPALRGMQDSLKR